MEMVARRGNEAPAGMGREMSVKKIYRLKIKGQ
jgi:hypothetical protein